jgi:hypothetical protein
MLPPYIACHLTFSLIGNQSRIRLFLHRSLFIQSGLEMVADEKCLMATLIGILGRDVRTFRAAISRFGYRIFYSSDNPFLRRHTHNGNSLGISDGQLAPFSNLQINRLICRTQNGD